MRSMTNCTTRRSRSFRIAIPPKIARLRKFGIYNVGWVGSRNDSDGLAVIRWWREKCIDWCHDYVDGGRFADQGYLDSFPGLSPRVRVIENIGANLAPWNVDNYAIDFRDGKVMVDAESPLIFFHFQGLKKGLRWFIFSSHRQYRAAFSATIRNHIYKPYVDELLTIERAVDPVLRISDAKPHRRSAVIDIRQYLESKVRATGIRRFSIAGYCDETGFSCVSRHGVLADATVTKVGQRCCLLSGIIDANMTNCARRSSAPSTGYSSPGSSFSGRKGSRSNATWRPISA